MNVEAPDIGFFLLRDRALQWLGGSTRQKTDATQQEIHVGTDLKALVDKQGEMIKKLQAELRDIKLSTSSVPVSYTPSRLCWTHHSIFNGIAHISPASRSVPRDGMALSDRLDFLDIPTPRSRTTTQASTLHLNFVIHLCSSMPIYGRRDRWYAGGVTRRTPPVPLVCRLSRLMSTVCSPLCNTNGAYQNCQL